jgi:hypothetical protein
MGCQMSSSVVTTKAAIMPAAKIELDLAQIKDTDIQKLNNFLTHTPDLETTKEISQGFV